MAKWVRESNSIKTPVRGQCIIYDGRWNEKEVHCLFIYLFISCWIKRSSANRNNRKKSGQYVDSGVTNKRQAESTASAKSFGPWTPLGLNSRPSVYRFALYRARHDGSLPRLNCRFDYTPLYANAILGPFAENLQLLWSGSVVDDKLYC